MIRPIKAAVAATAEHLVGLVPLHLVYGQAFETAIELAEPLDALTIYIPIDLKFAHRVSQFPRIVNMLKV
ncbi:hypothetical protein RJT34_04984 [Clitoria ternatea]|uniref:Uncharacterized protein n=1 Tax=Clitoria ternatea TaxID=43366 RepID=A0AAN9K375_CLITE